MSKFDVDHENDELEVKEELLKKYIRDLDRLIEPARNNENKTKDHTKEQAFQLLIKAEQLNEEIERDMKRISLLNVTDIEKLLNESSSFRQKRETARLKDEFYVTLDWLNKHNKKTRLKLDEFIGLDSFRDYLNSILTTTRDNLAWTMAKNSLVFGQRGCGKVSYLVNWLIETKLERVEVFFIDISQVLARSNVDAEFLGRLLDSINEHAQRFTLGLVLVVFNRLECLFDEKKERVRVRFLADLLYNIEINSPSKFFFKIKCFFRLRKANLVKYFIIKVVSSVG